MRQTVEAGWGIGKRTIDPIRLRLFRGIVF
jgi:hypothetical protein